MRQSGSKRAAHGARRALHTTQSCSNPAPTVADCGFRPNPTAILLQSRSIVARLHHLGPQSCYNRAPIVHQSLESPVNPIEPQSCGVRPVSIRGRTKGSRRARLTYMYILLGKPRQTTFSPRTTTRRRHHRVIIGASHRRPATGWEGQVFSLRIRPLPPTSPRRSAPLVRAPRGSPLDSSRGAPPAECRRREGEEEAGVPPSER